MWFKKVLTLREENELWKVYVSYYQILKPLFCFEIEKIEHYSIETRKFWKMDILMPFISQS